MWPVVSVAAGPDLSWMFRGTAGISAPVRQGKTQNMNIRAKMQVNSVTSTTYSDRVELSPVYGGAAQSKEDNNFAQATPGGKLELTIDNPALKGVMKAGQKYYIELVPVPEVAPTS